MLKSQGSPDPDAMVGAMHAFEGYTELHHARPGRSQGHRQHATTWSGCCARPRSTATRSTTPRSSTRRCSSSSAATRRPAMSSAEAWRSCWLNPTRWRRLTADPTGCMPGAVEEMLRWVSPIKNMARTATRDVELAGATIKEGQELLLLYPSANRDEAVFEDPDTFDITRSPNPHVAFGFGAHFCLGNQLARLELRVMFERLLARMPDIHLAAERDALPRRPANFISGFEDMPVAFTPSAPLGRRRRLMADSARRRYRRLVHPRHRRRERHRARHGGALRRRRRARHDLRAHRAEARSTPARASPRRPPAAPPSAPSWRTSPSRNRSRRPWPPPPRPRGASTACSPAPAARCTWARCSPPTSTRCGPPSTST